MKKILLFLLILAGFSAKAQDSIVGDFYNTDSSIYTSYLPDTILQYGTNDEIYATEILDGPTTGSETTCQARFKYEVNYDVMTLLPATAINFYDRSEGDVVEWFWDFGDGNTSTEKEPMHVFNHPVIPAGSRMMINPFRTVVLTIKTADGCSSSFTETINILDLGSSDTGSECAVAFGYKQNTDIQTLVPALVLDFYCKTDAEVVNYFWDFGDGTTSTEANPIKTYNYPIYPDGAMVKINPYRTITLTIETASGCKNSYSETINIFDGNSDPIPTCEARFKYYQTAFDSIGKTASFQLNNYSTGQNLTYLWQFDDGTTSTEAEPIVTFDLSQKERKVCFTITGDNGCVNTFCDAVYVDPYNGGGNSGNDCFVAFGHKVNYDVKPFVPALALDFYSKVNGDVVKYLWDFGDGTSSNEANPMHLFNYPSVEDSILGDPNPFRTICLTVTTASGCEASYCETINIYLETQPVEDCYVYFKYYTPEDVVTIPEVVAYKLFPVSNKGIEKIEWRFADGSISNELEPVKTFDLFGENPLVCVTITSPDGCTSQHCETIYIKQIPVDTIVYAEPVCNYKFKFTSSFPEWASSCKGKVTAQVVLNDSVVKPDYVYWSSGEETETIENLCPTNYYTVTARVNNECKFSSSFIFNSDGTVTEVPIYWWVTDSGDDSYIEYNTSDEELTVEWVLCDGSVYKGDIVPINKINCGGTEANLLMRDAAGNVVYSETVALKTATSVDNKDLSKQIKIYPNPVEDELNVQFTGKMGITSYEIADLSGKVMRKQYLDNGHHGVFTVNVSDFRKGVYLAKLFAGDKVVAVQRFIK
jgi:PKD repeat protein